MVSESIEDSELCKPIIPGHIFFPEKRNMTSAISLCKKMKSSMSVVENEDIQQELIQKSIDALEWSSFSDSTIFPGQKIS